MGTKKTEEEKYEASWYPVQEKNRLIILSEMLYPNDSEVRSQFLSVLFKNHEVILKEGINKTINDYPPDLKKIRKEFSVDKNISDEKLLKVISQAKNATKKKLQSEFISGFLKGFDAVGGDRVLLNSPALNKLGNDTVKRIEVGLDAGQVFLVVWELSNYEKPSSVNRAIQFLEKSKTTSRIGKKHIKETWSEFKNVSHLWAACIYYPEIINGWDSDEESQLIDFLEFICLSEAFRSFGETFFARSQKIPLLNKEKTWKPPSDLELPAMEFDMELNFEFPPLTPEIEELLKYSAK